MSNRPKDPKDDEELESGAERKRIERAITSQNDLVMGALEVLIVAIKASEVTGRTVGTATWSFNTVTKAGDTETWTVTAAKSAVTH